ncbi:unnamed protein product [Lepeophtheirus salmonis]|uniref:(salmon louse) hypothetical protein n=1 Tax=Lepeophtheirus salmonis TaxID=72036 RepID=A0A7R8CL70_LEPSM|nr:unnamed protein product [Lepeophtheirus salmonis]CAF2820229.1 unnamed protein product [Lepeophtheirus salmonis]
MGESSFPYSKGDATKALVFMISGDSTARWKQVVPNYFTPNAYDGSNIGRIIIDVFKMLYKVGIDIVNTFVDMRSQNLAMWKLFDINCEGKSQSMNKINNPAIPSNKLHFLAEIEIGEIFAPKMISFYLRRI